MNKHITLLFGIVFCLHGLVFAQTSQLELVLSHYNGSVKLSANYGEDFIFIDSIVQGTYTTPSKEYSRYVFNYMFGDGMYSLQFDTGERLEFFVDTKAKNFPRSLKIAANKEDIFGTTIFNETTNQALVDYQRQLQNAPKGQRDVRRMLTDNLLHNYAGTFVATYVQASQPIPYDPPTQLKQLPKDQQTQAIQEHYVQYMKIHFFDNYPWTDTRLLYTPLLEYKLNSYFRGMLSPEPDSLRPQMDYVLGLAKANPQTYNYVRNYLYHILRMSNIMGHDLLAVYIAETYFSPADTAWTGEAFMASMNEFVRREKMNAVGTIAADLQLQTADNTTISLHSVKSPLTLLYFFDPLCHTCAEITPKVVQLEQQYRNHGLKVYAVCCEHNREAWLEYTTSHCPNFINVFDQNNTSQHDQRYHLFAYPQIYLLDQDKRVLLKDAPFEAVEQYLKQR